MAATKKTASKAKARPVAINNPINSSRASAETVVNISSKAVRDMQASLTSEAQKTQDKLVEIGRESADTIAKSADAATKTLYEAINICRDNLESAIECGNISTNVAKEFGQEITDFVNQAAADQMEIAKAAFSCRTLNDVVELQNKVVRHTMESYFDQCSRLTNLLFECASDICEPINERITEASEQLNKAMSA